MEVLMLKQEDCAFCDQAEEILRRLASEYPPSTLRIIDFGGPEGQQLALRGGMLFPPGVFVDGEPFSYGRLSERKLRREIERRLSRSTQGVGS